jgi:hypothetical protein
MLSFIGRKELCENMDIRRIYKEELKNRLLGSYDLETHMFNNSYSRVTMGSMPPRRSYERFLREESADAVINSLADYVLDHQKPDPVFTTHDKRSNVDIDIDLCGMLLNLS